MRRQLASGCWKIATETDERSLLLQAHHALWATSLSQGELLACFAHASAGEQLYQVAEHAGMAAQFGSHDAGACGRSFHAVALVLHGDMAAAGASIRESGTGRLESEGPIVPILGPLCREARTYRTIAVAIALPRIPKFTN